ncbi:MAG: hypothetical protein FJ144_08340 [Deltaproteobacteria bacterium]|nr:hypothetical protein [Deltaproteobacteria bacterium]
MKRELRSRSALVFAAACACLFAQASAAEAGVDLKMRTVVPGNEKASGSGRMRVEGTLLRIDLGAAPSGAGATSLIFDGKNDVLRVVRHDDRSYVQIDEAAAAQLAGEMAEARRQIDDQLAKMPEAQRKMIERMLANGALPFPAPGGAAKKTPPLEAAATKEKDEVHDHSCRIVRLSRGGQRKGDVCVAPYEAVGLVPDDLAVVKELGRFQGKMTGALAGSVPGAEQPFELLDRVDGFPLRTRRTEGGKVRSETFFEDIQKVEITPDTFEIWKGYERKELPSPKPPR